MKRHTTTSHWALLEEDDKIPLLFVFAEAVCGGNAVPDAMGIGICF
jgi:hypothetical protein